MGKKKTLDIQKVAFLWTVSEKTDLISNSFREREFHHPRVGLFWLNGTPSVKRACLPLAQESFMHTQTYG